MGYVVGVDFGSALSMAGIVKWDNGFPSIPETVRVTAAVPSVAYVNADNKLLLGSFAHRKGEADPQRVIRDFKRRMGDPVPIMVDDWSEQTENIVAAVVRQIVDDIAAEEGARPDAIAVTHPASWGAYKQELLATALTDAGLTDLTLVSEPQAAATYTARVAPSAGRTMVVYDLGAGSFEAAVMARVGDGEFKMLGQSQGLDWLGGSDFDQAIFSRIQRAAGLKNFDTIDQALLASLSRLRQDCTVAKELLSIDTEATITVQAAGRRTRIRLVRSEFEELIRDAIEDTVDTTRRAIDSAELTCHDIDAIVLVGGSSRIPLVAQVVSAEFSLPIVVDSSPEASTSLGAAWFARSVLLARSVSAEVSSESPDLHSPEVVDDRPAEQVTPMPAAPAIPTSASPPTFTPAPMPAAPAIPSPASPPTFTPAPRPSQPAAAPSASLGPSRSAGSSAGAGPSGRRDQHELRGRHRRRGMRRYWAHVVGIIAAVALIMSADSALATSRANDGISPGGSRQADAVSVTTTSPEPGVLDATP